MKPRLAAFPKCYIDDLCVHRTMTLDAWIELGSTLDIDGLEFYSGFLEDDEAFLKKTAASLRERGLQMPMLCCSPDFTQPDPALLQKEIEREKRMIEITAFFGGHYCRVLSGQRRPGLAREAGVAQVVRVIEGLLPTAEKHGVRLILENHYKDNYWQHPEFAQKMDVFVEIVDRITSPWFGVNFDPSNAILAGEDPLVLLEQVKHRVLTMHASDRFLKSGTLDDLRKEEGFRRGTPAVCLAWRQSGRVSIDYDRIFSILSSVGFNSWISIEDGMNGMDDLRASVSFLREKVDQHFSD